MHRHVLVVKGKKKKGVAGPPLPSSAPLQTVSPLSSSAIQDVQLARELVPPITKIATNVSLAAPSPASALGEKPVDPLEGMVLVTSGIGQLSSSVPPVVLFLLFLI